MNLNEKYKISITLRHHSEDKIFEFSEQGKFEEIDKQIQEVMSSEKLGKIEFSSEKIIYLRPSDIQLIALTRQIQRIDRIIDKEKDDAEQRNV